MSKFVGVVIEESLKDKTTLHKVAIKSTKVEQVTASHSTPWLKQWTLHTFELPEPKAQEVALKFSESLEPDYWYVDFKDSKIHYVVFPGKIFKVRRSRPSEYKRVVEYGKSLGIPEHQLNFSPTIADWERSNR